jgi:LysM repeat protein
VDRVCPLLALAADHRTAVDGVDPAHRCHATDDPAPIERQQQAQLCLTPRHDHCQRYLQHVGRRGASPGVLDAGDGLVSTRLLVAPEPAWRGIAGRARRSGSGRALGITAGLVLATLAAVALAGPASSGGLTVLEAAGGPSPDPTTTDSQTPLPTLRPTATPTGATPEPTATFEASPTPAATATPEPPATPAATATPVAAATPVPPPQPVTYVVQAGDTLALIAQRFGTTVQAIQAANGIADPNEILIGTVLVIP